MHSKRSKLTGLLHKGGFKSDKCKTSMKMAMSRMKLMKNKRDVQLTQMKREVAQLLESGQEQTARIRVEHVIREEKTIAAYEFLEVYCELIVSRLHIIDGQKTCPIDLKEAIASVVFAAPRCADIPELTDIKSQFQSKYGKDFITSSLEVRPDSGVARMVVEKLSATAPDISTKVKALKTIAEENNIKWDPKGFEDAMTKPLVEKLEGRSSFNAQPAPFQPPPPVPTYQTPAYNNNISYCNNDNNNNSEYIPTGPTGLSNQSSDLPSVPTHAPAPPPVHVRVPSVSRPSEPQNMPDSDTEYSTVEEAAEAAAKSAEYASKAAKAAADMARHGSLSREQSNASSYKDSPRKQNSPKQHDSPKAPSNNPSADVPPPSPCHSSGSTDDLDEPKLTETKRIEKSGSSISNRNKVVVQKEEEDDYLGFNTKYSKSNSKGSNKSFGRGANWENPEEEINTDYRRQEEEEDFAALHSKHYNKSGSKGSSRKSSFGGGANWDFNEQVTSSFDEPSDVFFDDSRVETKKKGGLFEKETSLRNKREESSSNRGNPNPVFSFDHVPSPKAPRTSNPKFPFDDDVDDDVHSPPKAPKSTGSKISFDSVPSPEPRRKGSAFKEEISLLSILSTGGQLPPEPVEPKFDLDVESDLDLKLDSSPKFDSGPNFDNVYHSDHEVEEEAKIVEDVSHRRPSLFGGKEKEIKKEKEVISSSDERPPENKPQSMRTRPFKPLQYIPRQEYSSDSPDDDDSGNERVLNYGAKIGGSKIKVGNPYAFPPYTKPSMDEEPKASKKPIKLRDESVEEKRFYKKKVLREEPASPIPELGDSDEGDYEPIGYQKFMKLKEKKEMYSSSSRVGTRKKEEELRGRVSKNSPYRNNTSDEEEEEKPIYNQSSRKKKGSVVLDEDEYDSPTPPLVTRRARRGAVNNYVAYSDDEEAKEEEEVKIPVRRADKERERQKKEREMERERREREKREREMEREREREEREREREEREREKREREMEREREREEREREREERERELERERQREKKEREREREERERERERKEREKKEKEREREERERERERKEREKEREEREREREREKKEREKKEREERERKKEREREEEREREREKKERELEEAKSKQEGNSSNQKPMTFPLDMEALRARVKELQANMR